MFDDLLESYPDDFAETLAERDAWRRQMADQNPGLEFIVSDINRWKPGSTVTVAFLGGSRQLHATIAEVVASISNACSLDIDFGVDDDGNHRRWSTADTTHQADIRVSFDQPGYWSLVGTDSMDESIAPPQFDIGGRAHQRSLNLGRYDEELPDDFRRTVLHEFLHALAFKHEHQNMRGPCQEEFRWEDDDDYVPTTEQGRFVPDGEGRRPGIYTYLGGEPNNWSRDKIDHNLRSDGAEDGVSSEFDPASVMLYRFPPLFYKSDPSACAPSGDGDELSDGDRRGLDLLYPQSAEARKQVADRAADVAAALQGMESDLESLPSHAKWTATNAILARLAS